MRVLKLGGSLLACPQSIAALRQWLAKQPPMPSLIVAGGGPLADAVRQLDRVHNLPAERAHWLAIRAMSVTADLLAALLPEAITVRRLEQTATLPAEALAVVEVWHILRESEPAHAGTKLPAGWHVTSDSIAARLAEMLQADELVLLKSSLPPPTSVEEAARSGFVDEFFPQASAGLPSVRCVNVRDPVMPEQEWRRPLGPASFHSDAERGF